MKLSDLATAIVGLWALGALAWQPPRPPAPQQRSSEARPAVVTASASQLPDRRTLTQFPGP
jgi:hypothetical protein